MTGWFKSLQRLHWQERAKKDCIKSKERSHWVNRKDYNE